jgi:hypothetical protein
MKFFISVPISGRFNFFKQIRKNDMTRKLLILLGALTAVQLSAGSGIASDAAALPALREKAPVPREDVLALFVDALLEKDLEQRCSKLLVVIEKT